MIEVRRGPAGGVLWLDAQSGGQSVSLGGYCRYWIEGEQFGGFSCPEHPDEVGAVSYRWDGSRWVRGSRLPTLAGPVLVGEWLPDADWKAVRR